MSAEVARLQVEALTVRYGGVIANGDVTLAVREAEVVGLIGPNGAGKTTLIDAVTGFTPYEGTVRLEGKPLDGVRPHRRARRGLVRTFQSVEMFHDLDVLENALVGTSSFDVRVLFDDLFRPGRSRDHRRAREALVLAGIRELAELRPADLSLGQQKLLGVARALAAEPQVLLLDEPAAGLDSEESRALGRSLRTIADSGISVLLVDHDMDLVLEACDRVYVLESGRLLTDGTPDAVRRDPRVIAAYLGTPPGAGAERP